MSIFSNPILWTDGYKPSHWLQYPAGTTRIYSYWMSRGGTYKEVVPVGMKYYLDMYLRQRITMQDIDEAEAFFGAYFNDDRLFNREGFEIIVNEHDGYWPVAIKFAPEGMPIPTHNVLLTIENTDPRLPWVTNYLETLLSLLWYPSTVATISREIKKVILKFLRETGTPELIDWKLHDFGMRSATSIESGGIGGFGHLVNFKGSDTLSSIVVAKKIYGATENIAGSIPAAEHSTITSWGKEHEYDAYKNMIRQFGNSGSGLYAVVSDSYDIMNAVDVLWGQDLKAEVLKHPNLLVVRPDSGVPDIIVSQILNSLGKTFGYTVNEKGFKVLNHVRVIQGDGIRTPTDVERVLLKAQNFGWSADNIAFGCGTGLIQDCNRDTQKFAIKASSAIINDRIVDFRKEPITDVGKWSRAGKLKLVRDAENKTLKTVNVSEIGDDILRLVYRNGVITSSETLEVMRLRANEGL